MKQAERARALVGLGLHVGAEAAVKRQAMSVRGGDDLRGQQERGNRQRTPSAPVSKTSR